MLCLCGQPEHLVDHAVLCEDIPPRKALDLPFAQPMDDFIALDGPLHRTECSKPSARVHAPFHTPMILVDHIIQVLALPQQTGIWEGAVALKGIEGRRIRRILVHGDHVRERRMTRVQPPPENCSAASASRVARST
jgi:hypothetical protein